MAGPWSTVMEVRQRIADILVKTPTTLPERYNRLIDDGNGAGTRYDAANDIMEILGGIGFTVTQIDQWDARKTYNTDIAAYLTLINAGAANEYDINAVEKLDRRDMLRKLRALTISGTPQAPGVVGSGGGGVGAGGIDDSTYRFNMDTKF